VCANINLFMEMNEEEMEKYLQTFVTDIWHLLMQVCALCWALSQPGLCAKCWALFPAWLVRCGHVLGMFHSLPWSHVASGYCRAQLNPGTVDHFTH
jgi:hypothetical protein